MEGLGISGVRGDGSIAYHVRHTVGHDRIEARVVRKNLLRDSEEHAPGSIHRCTGLAVDIHPVADIRLVADNHLAARIRPVAGIRNLAVGVHHHHHCNLDLDILTSSKLLVRVEVC